MKAILRDRIWLEVDTELKNKVKKALSYKIPIRKSAIETIIVDYFDYKFINERTLSIPIGRLDLIPKDHEIIDKRVYNLVDFHIKDNIKLRPSQQAIYDKAEDNIIINAGCSFGKTFTGLALVEKFGQKTLIIVHTLLLLEQWVTEIKKVFGITPGILGKGLFEIDNDICIGINKTLISKASPTLYNSFGTVISDECHHIPAKTFNTIIDKFRARYKVGLSATLRRKDQKHFLITNYITHTNIEKPVKENSMQPKVIAIKSGIDIPSSIVWQDRVSKLLDLDDYYSLIYSLIEENVKLGHKVLTVSTRVSFLQKLHTYIDKSALIIGGSDNINEVGIGIENGTYTNIIGSAQIMSEGVSFNSLSALIIAMPLNSDITLEQLIGRIIREREGKLSPIIYDIILKGSTGKNQWTERHRLYNKMGYDIEYIKI